MREYALSRRVGARGAPDRRGDEVRAGAAGRQRAAVDVVEPLVVDADRGTRYRSIASRCRTTARRSTTCPDRACPVIRQPFRAGDLLPYWAYGRFSGNHLYDLRERPDGGREPRGRGAEREAADRLREALIAIEAPDDQFARLGLA